MLPGGTRGECEVHHLPYEDDVIAAFAGFPYLSAPGFEEAEAEQFPLRGHRLRERLRGRWPDRSRSLFCPECRAARDAWETSAAAAGHKHPYSEVDRQARVAAGGR
jgi:hypothetical protein